MQTGHLCCLSTEPISDFRAVHQTYLPCGVITGSRWVVYRPTSCFPVLPGTKLLIQAEDIFREDSEVIICWMQKRNIVFSSQETDYLGWSFLQTSKVFPISIPGSSEHPHPPAGWGFG